MRNIYYHFDPDRLQIFPELLAQYHGSELEWAKTLYRRYKLPFRTQTKEESEGSEPREIKIKSRSEGSEPVGVVVKQDPKSWSRRRPIAQL